MANLLNSNEIDSIIKLGIKNAADRIANNPKYAIPVLSSLIINEISLDELFEWCTHFCLGGDFKTRCKELENEVIIHFMTHFILSFVINTYF